MGLNNAARKLDFVGQEHRFGPLVNNDTGMNLDDAAQAAWEAGYFPELPDRPDVNTFLDALRGTHEGWSRRFLPGDMPEIDRFHATQEERHALEQQRFETGQPVWQDRSVPADEHQPFAPPEAYEDFRVEWRSLCCVPDNMLTLLDSLEGWTALAGYVAGDVGGDVCYSGPRVH